MKKGALQKRCEVREGAKRKQENGVQMGERVAATEYLEEAGGYIVCTMAISGLISLTPHPHKHKACTHTRTHAQTNTHTSQRAITLPCKTRPINSSPLSLGNGATLNTALVSQPIQPAHGRIHNIHSQGSNK